MAAPDEYEAALKHLRRIVAARDVDTVPSIHDRRVPLEVAVGRKVGRLWRRVDEAATEQEAMWYRATVMLTSRGAGVRWRERFMWSC
jgi:hypothetical protein